MTKRNLLFIPLLIGIGLGFFSCFDSGPNKETFFGPAVFFGYDEDLGVRLIGTYTGVHAIPSHSLRDEVPGNCIFLENYALDYDNQPLEEYYTATEIVKMMDVDQLYIDRDYFNSTPELGADTLPLLSVTAVTSNFFWGNFFVFPNSKDTDPIFRLVYYVEEPEEDDVKNLYLLAAKNKASEYVEGTVRAFNIMAWTREFGEPVTITDETTKEKTEYMHAKIRLKYFSGTMSGDIPQFTTVSTDNSSNVFNIYVLPN